jgi:hypothetical protein
MAMPEADISGAVGALSAFGGIADLDHPLLIASSIL